MSTTVSNAPRLRAPVPRVIRQRARTTTRDDVISAMLSAWMLVGLYVDGWAHNNIATIETFVTPWHALLYSGFAASAGWIAWLVLRGLRSGARGVDAVPVGYGLGVVGAVLFGAGGLADALWHGLLGIEVSVEALLSPPHLVLFVAGLLVLTSPLRAAWSSTASAEISSRRFLPALLSLTLATVGVAFFFQYASAFLNLQATGSSALRLAALPGSGAQPLLIVGILSVLVTNVIMLGSALFMLRRWHPPFGSVTLLFTAVAAFTATQQEFRTGVTVGAALAGGLAADALVRALRPSPSRPRAYRLVGGVVPLVLWGAYFGVLGGRFGLAWTPELWVGVTLLAGLCGLGLSLLVAPPEIPRAAAGGPGNAGADGRRSDEAAV